MSCFIGLKIPINKFRKSKVILNEEEILQIEAKINLQRDISQYLLVLPGEESGKKRIFPEQQIPAESINNDFRTASQHEEVKVEVSVQND